MAPEIPLFLLTFNCNKQPIDTDEFSAKLQAILPETPASLFVFGFQELCSIMDGCFIQDGRKHLLAANNMLLDALQTRYGAENMGFHTVGLAQAGAVGLVAITPFLLRFFGVKTASSGCGAFSSSLKGGAGLRVLYSQEGKDLLSAVGLSFACAHLRAYEGEANYTRRNSDALKVLRSLDFGDGYGLLKPNSHCFFMGDLNYRTAKKYSRKSAASRDLFALQDQTLEPQLREIEELVMKYDELSQGRQNGDVFAGFAEACITFRPTYKYHNHTAIYNAKRLPAWCDRILYQLTYKKARAPLKAKPLKEEELPMVHTYNCIDTYLKSDHRPVYLLISIPRQAPEPIVSPNGYLQILPSETPNLHFSHDSERQDVAESMLGPTQIYVKPTRLDAFTQLYIRNIADFSIGYGLWFLVTPRGRLLMLVALLALLSVLHYVVGAI